MQSRLRGFCQGFQVEEKQESGRFFEKKLRKKLLTWGTGVKTAAV